MKKIRVTIDEEGNVRKETFGWSDRSCAKDTIWLDDAIGKRTSVVFRTDSATATTNNSIQAKQ